MSQETWKYNCKFKLFGAHFSIVELLISLLSKVAEIHFLTSTSSNIYCKM